MLNQDKRPNIRKFGLPINKSCKVKNFQLLSEDFSIISYHSMSNAATIPTFGYGQPTIRQYYDSDFKKICLTLQIEARPNAQIHNSNEV